MYGIKIQYSVGSLLPPESSGVAPLVESRIPAGFPSPAKDFDVERLNLMDMLTLHPLTTLLWRVSGTSMVEAGIFDGDIIVVARSLQARHGDVVVVQVDNGFTVKYQHKRAGRVKLVPALASATVCHFMFSGTSEAVFADEERGVFDSAGRVLSDRTKAGNRKYSFKRVM